VREDNYSKLVLQSSTGYVPDLTNLSNPNYAFKENGLAQDHSHWVAFNYKPFPSTFWPTNGSTDDVMLRLPQEFRSINGNTEFNEDIYFLNLSLLEMAIKELKEISIPLTDERALGLDVNKDGKLRKVNKLSIDTHYLGNAKHIKVIPLQYPTGTEFLHTVRYIDVNEHGDIQPSARMKEVRYMKKYKTLSTQAINFLYNQEHREKEEERLPKYSWNRPAKQAGMNNKMGWYVQGWIEDKQGDLRRANYEENLFCMGCHTTIGSTIDHTFSFPRKITGATGWGYINLKGMFDAPNYGEEKGEIHIYFERVGGGDEFRQNQEMLDRWFTDGVVNKEAIKGRSVYELITPSKERALNLNKAYRLIVQEQSFHHGRDATLSQAKNVYETVDQENVPTLPSSKQFQYDLRLQWPDPLEPIQ
jgi:hypothetical protein